MPERLLVEERRGAFIVLLLCCCLIFFSIGAAGSLLFQRAQSGQDIRFSFCVQIEALKTAQRTAANENYQKLDQNAKLLGIKVTPELRAAAKHNWVQTLRRFAPHNC